jgi:hypothetical protein
MDRGDYFVFNDLLFYVCAGFAVLLLIVFIRRLKGNTGEPREIWKIPELSPQLLSTFCCWPSICHCLSPDKHREGVGRRQRCGEPGDLPLYSNFNQSFRVKGDE